MPPWFFHPDLPAEGEELLLDDREAAHAGGARRLKAGAAIILFDGRGAVADAELLEWASRGRVRVRVAGRRIEAPPCPVVHLAFALPKGDRQAVLLNMATQLGAASLTPLECERSVVRCTEAFGERARRICIEACKQSRRAHVPQVRPAETPAGAASVARSAGAVAWACDPRGRRLREALGAMDSSGRAIVLLVGPEGGFTDGEIDAARAAGAEMLSLGAGILRIETAAVAALAAIMLTA